MFRRIREAFTIVELLVVVLILGVFLSMINTFCFSANRQGAKQDRDTATWHTYSGAIEALRMDLANATKLDVDDHIIEMKVVKITEDFKFIDENVVWAQEKNKLTRSSNGRKITFDFGSSLLREDILNIRFALLP